MSGRFIHVSLPWAGRYELRSIEAGLTSWEWSTHAVGDDGHTQFVRKGTCLTEVDGFCLALRDAFRYDALGAEVDR